jgi:DNA repair exonuclease SbcCD ATPase subunit
MSLRWVRPGNDIEGDECEVEHLVSYVDDDTVECDVCGKEFQTREDELVDYHESLRLDALENARDDRRAEERAGWDGR